MTEKKNRRALHRGLNALISKEILDASEEKETASLEQSGLPLLPVTSISSNPYQPRGTFDEEELVELKSSIQKYGVLEPVIVRKSKNGYELVSGERRLRAVRALGIETIPAVIREKVSDREMQILSLVENQQRADLNDLEIAMGYNELLLKFNYTHEKIADDTGKSRPYVSNILRLLKLPDEIKQAITDKKISSGHARALLSINDEEEQLSLLEKIITEGLNVRQIESLVDGKKEGKVKAKIIKSEEDYNITELESRLSLFLKTRIQIKKEKEKGKIIVHFADTEDLNRIIDIFK